MRRFNLFKIPRGEVINVMEREISKELDIEDEMFAKTYRTWRHRPLFVKDIKVVGNNIIGEIYTFDQIYKFLDEGTDVRYAKMDPRFRAKTKVRTIASYRGKYPDPIGISNKPLPGIKPREFVNTITKRRQYKFTRNIKLASENLIRRYSI